MTKHSQQMSNANKSTAFKLPWRVSQTSIDECSNNSRMISAKPLLDWDPRKLADLKVRIHQRLLSELDIRRLADFDNGDSQLRDLLRKAISAALEDDNIVFPSDAEKSCFTEGVLDEILGLSHLEEFLRDPEVTEIMVNGPHNVFIERNGRVEATDKVFLNNGQVLRIIEKIVSAVGRRIDESSPMVDARLPDGSRVNAVIPPLSLVGPVLTIRKFSHIPLTGEDLVSYGSLTDEMLELLMECVQRRYNILISGGTGSGKTTLLNVISSFIEPTERIVTIEDAAELKLRQSHVIALESRPPNVEGRGTITIRDLVRNALRMRPDRIIVGEVRGGEALDMLQAMNTGHNGSMTTCHANTSKDALARLETMVLMAGMDLPLQAVRSQIAGAINIIIQQSRLSNGSRCITSIAQVRGLDNGEFQISELYRAKMSRQGGISFESVGSLTNNDDIAVIIPE